MNRTMIYLIDITLIISNVILYIITKNALSLFAVGFICAIMIVKILGDNI